MPEHLVERAHLLDLLQLLEKILQRELRLAELLLERDRLLLVDLLLRLLDERDDVAHAEDPRGHAVGMERSSASGFSPMPMNLIGLPTVARSESAAPPRASPSIFVRTAPSNASRSWNAWAVLTASWPVIASTTNRISCGRTAALIASTSRIISSST